MRKSTASLLLLAISFHINAQQSDQVTVKDYDRAVSFLRFGTQPYVDNGEVNPVWTSGDHFWYKNFNSKGSEIIVVDAAKGTISPSEGPRNLPVVVLAEEVLMKRNWYRPTAVNWLL